MTAALRLNGITVPVLANSFSESPTEIGGRSRAVDGSPILNRRGRKLAWRGRTVPKTAQEAFAWRDLIRGEGHTLNFEDATGFYTSKGLPTTLKGANFTISASNPKYGTKRANSANAANNTATWQMFTSTSPWTVSLWVSDDAGATWHHHLRDSAGRNWFDGVRDDATFGAFTYFGVASGLLTLGVAAAAWAFDDVVGFPQLMPTDWPTQIRSYGAAFGTLYKLKADGEVIEQNATMTVLGQATEMVPISTKQGGTLTRLWSVNFELEEA